MSQATIYDKDLLALQEMRTAVQKAKEAQAIYQTFTQEQVDAIVKHVAEKAYEASETLAELAVKETKMGVVEHKKIKNEVGSRDVYESIKDTYGRDCEINVFPAMPISIAIETGRCWMKKAHPRLTIYDEKNGFKKALEIKYEGED